MDNLDAWPDHAHEKLFDLIADAKRAGHDMKAACGNAINHVIGSISKDIKDNQSAPVPAKFFDRLKDKWHRHCTVRRLHHEIETFEKAKIFIDSTLVDSYQDAEKLVDKVLSSVPEKLDLKSSLLEYKRAFRAHLMGCTHALDAELEKLRDAIDDKCKKCDIKKLMNEATFTDSQKLSRLESIMNKARLIPVGIAAAVVAEDAVKEEVVDEPQYVPEAESTLVYEEPAAENVVEPVEPAYEPLVTPEPVYEEPESIYAPPVVEEQEEIAAAAYMPPAKPEEEIKNTSNYMPHEGEDDVLDEPIETYKPPENLAAYEMPTEDVVNHEEAMQFPEEDDVLVIDEDEAFPSAEHEHEDDEPKEKAL